MPDRSRAQAYADVCPECGWNFATSDGRCLDCPSPPVDDETGADYCQSCGADLDAGAGGALDNGYCWSCGEPA